MANYTELIREKIAYPEGRKPSAVSDEYIEKAKEAGFTDEDIEFFSLFSGFNGVNFYLWFISPLEDNWEDVISDLRESYTVLKESEQEDIAVMEGSDYKSWHHYQPQYPFEFYPEDNGLIPWAQADNGTVFYFLTSEDKPWSVVVYDDMSEYYEYEMSAAEFFCKLICGEIENTGLPHDLFDNGVVLE